MDFLKMDFSTLFLNKHGKEMFNNITEQIKLENSNKYSQDYVEAVFKISLLDFWGLNESEIKKIFEDIMQNEEIDVVEIKAIHKESIYEIKKYLELEIENFNK